MKDWPTMSEMTVLRILQDHPRGLYGLKVVDNSGGAIKSGSVYVLLGRLEEKGFVKVARPTDDPDYPGLPRPIYQITGEGKKVLVTAERIGLELVGAPR